MASNAKSRGFRLLSFAAKWALATALAWLLSLLLFSTQPGNFEYDWALLFGPTIKTAIHALSAQPWMKTDGHGRRPARAAQAPIFRLDSWTTVVLFSASAGFLSSTAQWWLLRRHLAHTQWWIAATTAGALVGVLVLLGLIWIGLPYEVEVPWFYYPLTTALPVSILQGAFLIWRAAADHCPGTIKLAGGTWIAVRPVLLAVVVLFGLRPFGLTFESLGYSTFSELSTPVTLSIAFAVGYAVFFGLPFGFLSGLYLEPIFAGLAKGEAITPWPQGLADLPPVDYRRRTRAGSRWLLAVVAVVVVLATVLLVMMAIALFRAGFIPPR